jgi:hypothetical protein
VKQTTPRSDRRAGIRLEVVGSLWASFEASEPARLVNFSRNGALIASRTPHAADNTRIVRFTFAQDDIGLEALVRHIRPVTDDAGAVYLIGVEFVSDRDVVNDVMARLGVSLPDV